MAHRELCFSNGASLRSRPLGSVAETQLSAREYKVREDYLFNLEIKRLISGENAKTGLQIAASPKNQP